MDNVQKHNTSSCIRLTVDICGIQAKISDLLLVSVVYIRHAVGSCDILVRICDLLSVSFTYTGTYIRHAVGSCDILVGMNLRSVFFLVYK
jgi:hypothetical protein